jgi:pimeloyl-ACP methyl ester carboxylesterase
MLGVVDVVVFGWSLGGYIALEMAPRLPGMRGLKLGDALVTYEARGANPAAVAVIRLLAFTGARKGEIAGLRWSEVDLERGYLRLGDSKTGAKVVPLGAPGVEILAGVMLIEGSPFDCCFG